MMKISIRIIGTICFSWLLLVSGVLAQEVIEAPLNSRIDTASGSFANLHARVSIIEYVKALETINAYNSVHKEQLGIPGVTRVSLRLVPQLSYQEIIASKLRSWDKIRIDQLALKHKTHKNAVPDPRFRYTQQRNWASTWFDNIWQAQEFVDEFNLGRFISYQDGPEFSSPSKRWPNSGR
jgi:hypothetical protein